MFSPPPPETKHRSILDEVTPSTIPFFILGSAYSRISTIQSLTTAGTQLLVSRVLPAAKEFLELQKLQSFYSSSYQNFKASFFLILCFLSTTTVLLYCGILHFLSIMEAWTYQIKQQLSQIEQWIRQQPAEQLYIAIAAVIIASVLLFLFRCFNRSTANSIILAGLSGSGKTILFYQLRDGSSHHGTVTSMEPNDDTFLLHCEVEKKGKIKPVRVVDVPGHSRLRPKLDEFLPQAASLIFVVDALDFLPNCRAAAEFLYDVLSKAIVVKKKIPVLILCNKMDKVTAHSKDFIRKQLEKEIDKLRTSRTAISSADVTNEYTLGVPGEAFSFSQCLNKVTVAEASGITGEISQPEQFIREHVNP